MGEKGHCGGTSGTQRGRWGPRRTFRGRLGTFWGHGWGHSGGGCGRSQFSFPAPKWPKFGSKWGRGHSGTRGGGGGGGGGSRGGGGGKGGRGGEGGERGGGGRGDAGRGTVTYGGISVSLTPMGASLCHRHCPQWAVGTSLCHHCPLWRPWGHLNVIVTYGDISVSSLSPCHHH